MRELSRESTLLADASCNLRAPQNPAHLAGKGFPQEALCGAEQEWRQHLRAVQQRFSAIAKSSASDRFQPVTPGWHQPMAPGCMQLARNQEAATPTGPTWEARVRWSSPGSTNAQ